MSDIMQQKWHGSSNNPVRLCNVMKVLDVALEQAGARAARGRRARLLAVNQLDVVQVVRRPHTLAHQVCLSVCITL